MLFVKKASIWVATLVAFLILGGMAVAVTQNGSLKRYGTMPNVLIAALFCIFAVVTSLGLTRVLILKKKSNMVIFLVVIFLALLKIPFLFILKFNPTYDFYNYFYYGQQTSTGATWHYMWASGILGTNVLSPHVLNISWLFSVLFNFFTADFIVAQLTSIVLSGLNVFLMYLLLSQMLSKQLALFSSLLFYFIPAYWLYSLLDAPESLFLTFLLGSLISFNSGLSGKHKIRTKNYFYLTFSLILLFIANMIRPVVMVWIIAILFMEVFSIHDRNNQTSIEKRAMVISVYALTFVILSVGSTQFYRFIYGIDIAPAAVERQYSFATGTNVKNGGQFNGQIAGKVDQALKANSDSKAAYRQISQEMKKTTVQNLGDIKKVGLNVFLWEKVRHLMQEEYGTNWILYNLSAKDPNHYYKRLIPFTSVMSVIYFDMLLLMTIGMAAMFLIAVFDRRILKSGDLNSLLFGSLLLDGFFLASMIFEVQGRYHIVLYIPVMLLFGMGCKLIYKVMMNKERISGRNF